MTTTVSASPPITPGELHIVLENGLLKIGTCEHCVVREHGRPAMAWDADGDKELDFINCHTYHHQAINHIEGSADLPLGYLACGLLHRLAELGHFQINILSGWILFALDLQQWRLLRPRLVQEGGDPERKVDRGISRITKNFPIEGSFSRNCLYMCLH